MLNVIDDCDGLSIEQVLENNKMIISFLYYVSTLFLEDDYTGTMQLHCSRKSSFHLSVSLRIQPGASERRLHGQPQETITAKLSNMNTKKIAVPSA